MFRTSVIAVFAFSSLLASSLAAGVGASDRTLYLARDARDVPFLLALRPDGTATASPHFRQAHSGADHGTWEQAAPTTIRIEWESGYWDLLQTGGEVIELFAFNLRNVFSLVEEFQRSVETISVHQDRFAPWLEPGPMVAVERLDGYWTWSEEAVDSVQFLRLDRWGRVLLETFTEEVRVDRLGFWRPLTGTTVFVQWMDGTSTTLERGPNSSLDPNIPLAGGWEPITRADRDGFVVQYEREVIQRALQTLRETDEEERQRGVLSRLEQQVQSQLGIEGSSDETLGN